MNNVYKFMNWLMIVAVGCGLSIGAASCGGNSGFEQKQTSFPTMTISKSDIEMPMKFSAKMKGKSDVTITPQVSGQLMKINVTEGQHVKRGTVMFVIDQRNAQLELESAEANLQAAVAQESSAKLEYESNKNLFEKKIVSSYMLENSLNTYNQAKASVVQARAAVNRARVNLGFCTITAPVDGMIGEIPVSAGDQVSPMTQLTVVSGNDNMHAEFSVSEAVLEYGVSEDLKKGEAIPLAKLPDATFILKNGTEYKHKGRVISVTGVVDEATGTITCKASFPNPDGQLYSGIQGSVVMPFQEKDVIVIPQNAVVRLQDKSLVYKVGADSCAVSATVTIESAGNGKDVIVLSGLEEGDVIVTEGANNVHEGQKVLFPKVVTTK